LWQDQQQDLRAEARGAFLTLPLGANFDPQGRVNFVSKGEVIPWG
jgi:hypothetical protein